MDVNSAGCVPAALFLDDPENPDLRAEDNSLGSLLLDPSFWTILHPHASPIFMSSDCPQGLGFRQPFVRRAGWAIVRSLSEGKIGTGVSVSIAYWILIIFIRHKGTSVPSD
jgi:hypothetical protein